MKLTCENYTCIYQKDGICILENVKIDRQGLCDDCVYPNINFEKLEEVKESYRKFFLK